MAKVSVGDRVEIRHIGPEGGRIGTVRRIYQFGMMVEILCDDADSKGVRVVRVGRQAVKPLVS